MRNILDKLQQKRNLTRGEMQALMTEIMSGRAPEEDIRDFLTFMNDKGPSVEEIFSAAAVMRKFVVPVKTSGGLVFDVVGTGGDGKHTFNISTLSAFITSACGVKVAKHGNRSVSSRCGSADVLEALGVNINLPHEKLSACLDEVGLVFLFAQQHHPAMKHVAAIRKELGVKTIFNILGPLTNPAGATHQMVGVYSKHLVEQLVLVLKELGITHALVVHGADGLDEITTTDKTFISEYNGHDVTSYEITPEEFGFNRASEADLKGGESKENITIAMDLLQGKPGPKQDIVLLNAGFSLYTAGRVATPEEGIILARETLLSGKALKQLEALKEFTHRG